MKTAADIVKSIENQIFFRCFIHKTMNMVEYHNIDIVKELKDKSEKLFRLRTSLDFIAIDMIMKGEY